MILEILQVEMRIFFALVIFFFLPSSGADSERATKIIQFLLKNHELCGKPFADAEWIPVLDMCDKECDELKEICVENDSLVQKCQKRELLLVINIHINININSKTSDNVSVWTLVVLFSTFSLSI